MTETTLVRRRTGWDIILGILVVLAGFVLLGNAALATTASMLFVGWVVLISGLLLVITSLFRIRSGGFVSAALGGAMLTVLGLFLLRNPLIGALTLTLLAGALFLAGGLTRILLATQVAEGRWLLGISGAISVGLGIWVLFNLETSTTTLLGILLGVQTVLEGLTLIFVGRLRAPKTA